MYKCIFHVKYLILGTDLNRAWDESDSFCHPTIHAVKQLIESLSKSVNLNGY